jgi:cell division protein FtsB
LHAECMFKDEAEDLVAQAEAALVRMRKGKDSAEEGRLALVQEVERWKATVEDLAARNEELEAENDRSKQQIADLTKQRARLTKLCGLRPARNASISPRVSPISAHALTPTVTKSPSSRPKTPLSGSTSKWKPLNIKSRSSQSADVSGTSVDTSPATSSNDARNVCDTSYSPIITQEVLTGFDKGVQSPSGSTPHIHDAPSSMRQGSMTVFTVSKTAAHIYGEALRCSPPSLHETKMSLTVPVATEFGRHSAERGQRHKEQRLSDPMTSGTTPWKQERRLTELAKKNQIMRSNIARAEKQNDQLGNRNAGRRSLDESRRRFSREQFILEHACTVPAFVTDALRKQLANKDGIDRSKKRDKENVAVSPPPAAVEISMEATKANVSMSGSAMKKSARIRRSTISGGHLREM